MMRKVMLLICGLLLAGQLVGCNLGGSERNDGEEDAEVTLEVSPQVALEPTATLPFVPTRTALATTPLPTTGSSTTSQTTTQGQSQTVQIAPVLQPLASGQHAYVLQTSDGLTGAGVALFSNVTTAFFAPNPANPNRYAVIDTSGMVYLTEAGGANASRVEQGPYTIYPAPSRAENNAAADMLVWSPSGQYLAFIVNADLLASDGVWYFEPGVFGPLQLIVDCPSQGFTGCDIVRPSPRDPRPTRLWESRDIQWSPNSQSLLINVYLPEFTRRSLIVQDITRNDRIRDERPPVIFYDYGSWGADGNILASGRNPDGTIVVDWINRDGTLIQPVYPASLNGLWMGWAVQQADGDIYALGRPGADNGPVAIYDMDGIAVTGFIGDAFPQRVVWSPDRSAVLVETNGRQFVASVDGQVTEVTSFTGGRTVNWGY